MKVELPPPEFSNVISDIKESFDWNNWRKSLEWRVFVAGYNAAVKKANASVMAQYNFGQVAEKVFGK